MPRTETRRAEALVSLAVAARDRGVSVRRMQALAKSGRIVGARKIAGVWLVPRPVVVEPRAHGPAARADQTRATSG